MLGIERNINGSCSIKLNFRLYEGKFIQRLNRFLAEIDMNGQKVLAHLPNSGRMLTVLFPNCRVFLVKKESAKRKSKYTMFAVQHNDISIIVDTRFANKITRTLIENKVFTPFRRYRVVKENVLINSSRIDFLLERNGRKFYLEVKSVSYVVNGVAMFPDAPTLRGRKHLKTLMKCLKEKFEAGVLFTVQRPDAKIVKPCYEIDLEFSNLLKDAHEKGLKIFTQMLVFKPPNKVQAYISVPKFSFQP